MSSDAGVAGMLYVVNVRLVHALTDEKIKHRIILVGCERDDVERKLRWMFDKKTYSQFRVTSVVKVTNKVHILSTSITQPSPLSADPIIMREGGSEMVGQSHEATIADGFKKYAIGLATSVLARSESHALRKLAATLADISIEEGGTGRKLSDGSTLTIEELSVNSGYATARDVTNEINNLHFVRG